jgi:hypothetical protein
VNIRVMTIVYHRRCGTLSTKFWYWFSL